MNDHPSEQEPPPRGREPDPKPDEPRASRGREQFTALWNPGALFHVSARYPRKPNVPRVDRLAGILRQGLLAPASCQDGAVCSDLTLEVIGTPVPYDSLIFLHRFGPPSFLYIPVEPGRFAVFVDPELPVLTPETIGSPWVVLSQDEVYVRDRIAPEDLIGVAVHRVEAEAVMRDLLADFQRLGIPLYDFGGDLLWPPA